MRGAIATYDAETGVGSIRAGKSVYRFKREVIHDVTQIQVSMPVLFVAEGDEVIEAVPQPSFSVEDTGSAEFQRINERSGPGPLRYFLRSFRKYFDFSGRAQRVEFWSVWSIFYGIVFVAEWVAMALTGSTTIAALVYLTLFALMLCPGLALTWRRFHDIGWGGAAALLTVFPLVGWSVALIVAAFVPSQRHTNRFGPHPKAVDPQIAEVFE